MGTAFDVFISYAKEDKEDQEWVDKWLVPRLKNAKLRVCTDSDFDVGVPKLTNITRAVDNSRHSLVILTPAWVENEWQAFEGLLIQNADPAARHRKLLPLLLRDCKPPERITGLTCADFRDEAGWEKQILRIIAAVRGELRLPELGPNLISLITSKEAPFMVPFLRNPNFVGRKDEMQQLHVALQGEKDTIRRPVGLIGMGGVGKTQLAVEYVFLYRESYPDGIFWINAFEPLDQGFAALGRQLQPRLADGTKEEQIDGIVGHLKARPQSLLILDNLSDSALLKQPVASYLIPAGLPCYVLFTTRQRNIGDFRAVALPIPPPESSLQLLLHHETRRDILDPAHAEHAEAKSICALLGYLPLALEIAAAQLARRPEMPLAAYHEYLLARGALPVIDDPRGGIRDTDLGTRHTAAVKATLSEQWNTLESDDSRLLLRVAGLLPESAIIPVSRLGLLAGLSEVAEGFFGSPLNLAVEELVNASLMASMAGGQVRLHPLIQEFALGQTPDVESSEFRQRCVTNLATAYDDFVRLEAYCAKRGIEEIRGDLTAAQGLLRNHIIISDKTQKIIESLYGTLQLTPGLQDWNPQLFPALFAQQVHNQAVITDCSELVSKARERLDSLQQPYLALLWRGSHFDDTLEPPRENMLAFQGKAVIPSGLVPIYISALRSLLQMMSVRDFELYKGPVKVSAQLAGLVSDKNYEYQVDQVLGGQPMQFRFQFLEKVNNNEEPPLEKIKVSQNVKKIEEGGLVIGIQVSEMQLVLKPEYINNWIPFLGETHVTVGPEDQWAVAASSAGLLKLWDLQTGRLVHTFSGHSGPITSVGFTKDGSLLVSGSLDGTIKVWNTQTGDLRQDLGHHTSCINKVLVRQGFQQIISASQDSSVILWSLTTDNPIGVLQGHSGPISDLAFFAEERLAVSASWDTTLRVWDLDRQRGLFKLKGHSDVVHGVAILPHLHKVVSASSDGSLRLWNLETGKQEGALELGVPVYTVKALPNSKGVVFLSKNGLATWNLRENAAQYLTESNSLDFGVLFKGTNIVHTDLFSPKLTVLSTKGSSEKSEAKANLNQVSFAVVRPDLSRIAVCKDGQTFLVGDTFGNVYCFVLHMPSDQAGAD